MEMEDELRNMNVFHKIADDISSKGWSVSNELFDLIFLSDLLNELNSIWLNDEFKKAAIGRANDQAIQPEIRGDFIYWLNPKNLSVLQNIYFGKIDELRLFLNREFFLALENFEAHFAVYPPKGFYKRHLDQFLSQQLRMITCITYLNFDWKKEYGGILRIYDYKDDRKFEDVIPNAGTFVCFRSDKIYHEVLPSTKQRFSLTGWLRKSDVFGN